MAMIIGYHEKIKAPQTAIVPASSMYGLQVDALERRVAKYKIPSDQVDAVTKLYEAAKQKDIDDFKAADIDAYADAVKKAIQDYKQKHPWIQRMLDRRRHKGWKDKIVVPIPSSERTDLLESIVTTRDIVLEGYEMFRDLPDIISKTYKDYAGLKSRQKELEAGITSLEKAAEEVPLLVAANEKILGQLSDYSVLSEEERKQVFLSVFDAMKELVSDSMMQKMFIKKAEARFAQGGLPEYKDLLGALRQYSSIDSAQKLQIQDMLPIELKKELLPSLESASGRKIIADALSEMTAQKQLLVMNCNANLELSRQELESVVEQQKLIEEQMDELSQTWLPTLKHIDGARMRYDSMARFAESSAKILGMNKLRARNVEANAEAQAAIARCIDAQRDSRIAAEAFEEGAEEVKKLYAGRTAEADAVLAAPEPVEFVAAEPIVIERRKA
ncbi:MAG: hypothetical protein PHO02_03825 [Candidatus Nanoarchaeia archaeon]|nr:hypothetical protein [Candidatus Nanoarchaeia archaeon]